MKITKYFSESEFKVSAEYPDLAKEIDLFWPDLVKLFYMCSCILEPARNFYKHKESFLITSGKRSPELNFAVKGAKSSDHLFFELSCAVDFTMRDKDKLFKVYSWIWEHCFYSVGEMILYLNRSWNPRFIHVSLPTKKHHSEFYFDWNKGETFSVIQDLPDSVYMKIFGEEVR